MSSIPDFNDFSKTSLKPAFLSGLALQAGSERGIAPGGFNNATKPVENKELPNLFYSFTQSNNPKTKFSNNFNSAETKLSEAWDSVINFNKPEELG